MTQFFSGGSALFSPSPQIWLNPNYLPLLVPHHVLQRVQQGGAVAPALRGNGTVPAGQLVQQWLLTARTVQQLSLRHVVLAQLVSVRGNEESITEKLRL